MKRSVLLSGIILGLFIFLPIYMVAQNVAITDDETYEAKSSAMLDVYSQDKGFLVPRLTSTQRNNIASPVDGLLVFDTDSSRFFYYSSGSWNDVAAEGIWVLNANQLSLSNQSLRVGIGNNNVNSKLEVRADASFGSGDTLFVVKNALGQPVFAVFPDGAKLIVNSGSKGSLGGFAVSGRTPGGKTIEEDYLRVTPDSTRVYVNEGSKGSLGGFAVSGRTPGKASILNDYFNISGETAEVIDPSEARVLWYPNKEAFMAGRVLVQSASDVGQNSIALGYESRAIGDWSQAMGYEAIAGNDYSTAIGNTAQAAGLNSYAFGNGALAEGENAYAIGRGAIAQGLGSFAIGSTGVDSTSSTTENAIAAQNFSFAIGLGTRAFGLGSTSLGANSYTSGKFSIALGYYASATGDFAVAFGPYSQSSGYSSGSIGRDNRASGPLSFAAGWYNRSGGYASVALGADNNAIGNRSVAMGDGSKSEGFASIAMGKGAEATAISSIAMGQSVSASGMRSIAMGTFASTNGKTGSFVFGDGYEKGQVHALQDNQVVFKAIGGMRFYADPDTLESSSFTIAPESGYVGVGTWNPQAQMDVQGVVMAWEFVPNGKNIEVSDYVFYNDYELESIEEHAAFMWEKKHLPALQSANEIKNNSYKITERQEQIVEELEKAHIYIEQLHKRQKQLEKENTQLREQYKIILEKLNELMN